MLSTVDEINKFILEIISDHVKHCKSQVKHSIEDPKEFLNCLSPPGLLPRVIPIVLLGNFSINAMCRIS